MFESGPKGKSSFCSGCGKPIGAASNFCQNCGQKASVFSPQISPTRATSAGSHGGKWVFLSVLAAVFLALGAAALSPGNVLDSWSPSVQDIASETMATEEAQSSVFPAGYQEIDGLWAIDFKRPLSCQGESGSCIRVLVRTTQQCSEISIAYQLQDGTESRSLNKTLSASFDSGRSQAFVSGNFNWQSSRWRAVSLESLDCINSGVKTNSSYVWGRAKSTLRVANYAPDGFTTLGDRIAYRWVDATDCQQGLRVCWSAEVVSAKRCQAVVGTFNVEYANGSLVDIGVRSAANLGLAPGEPRVIQFGSPTPIVKLDNLRISAIRFDCLDEKIADTAEYAITFSQIDANDALCENQSCALATQNQSEFDRLVELLSKLNGYAGNSGGSGYTVRCADGWISNSGGKQGACSWHGGIAD